MVNILSSKIKWLESLTAMEEFFFILKLNVYIMMVLISSTTNNDVFYLSVDKLRYDEKLQIINVWKDGELKVYNYDFSQIQTGYDQIEKTELKQGTSRFYLGKKDNMWGMFRIKRAQKHELEIITTLDPVCCNPEEVLLAFKNSRHSRANTFKAPTEGKFRSGI